MKIMVWCAALGGMRSVVEAYQRDGFIEQQDVTLIASYVDGSLLQRQLVLLRALAVYLWYLATRRVELVHAHAAMRGSFWRKGLFASLARLFSVPVILHLHGSEMKPFYESQPGVLRQRIRRQLEKAACVVVLSESWRTFVAGIAPMARIAVVPNYVPVPATDDAGERHAQNILFLGLIGSRKGVFDLISAFAAIAPEYPEARLTIGGNGDLAQARELIASLKLDDRIRLAGWIKGDAKDDLLRESGIYILPSYNEGLPMSVLEAMAAGLAVITTRVGGIPELITHDVDGLLFDAGDRAALERSMAALLSSDEQRRRLAAAGRRRILEKYSDQTVLPLLQDIYRKSARRRAT